MPPPLVARHPRGREPETLPDAAGVRRIPEQLPAADDSDALTRMLPPDCYTDPAFFAFEQRAVFTHAWLCVGRVEQIPNVGDCLPANPAGEPILVIRGETNEINALSAVCQQCGAVLLACPAGAAGAAICAAR